MSASNTPVNLESLQGVITFSSFETRPDDNRDVVRKVFNTSILKYNEAPLVSPTALNAGEVTTNISLFFRELYSTIPALDGNPAFPLMGLSSLVNAVNGSFNYYLAVKKIEESERALDKKGALEGRFKLVKSVLQVSGGLAFGVYRGLNVGSIMHGALICPTATTLLGRVTFWVGGIATGLFVVYFLWNAITLGMNVGNRHHLLEKLDDEKNPAKAEAYLRKRLYGSDQTAKRYKEFIAKPEKEQMDFLATEGAKRMLHMVKQHPGGFSDEVKNASMEDLKNMILGMLETSTDRENAIKDGYAHILDDKKTHKFDRIFGEGKAAQLKAALDRGETIEQIIDGLKMESAKADLEQYIVLAFLLFAALSLALSLVYSGPVILAMLIFLSFGGFILDFHEFYKDYKAGNIAKYDTLAAKINLAIIGAALVISMVVLSILSGGSLPVILLLSVGIPWICLQLAILYLAHKKRDELERQEQIRLNPPDPVTFSDAEMRAIHLAHSRIPETA